MSDRSEIILSIIVVCTIALSVFGSIIGCYATYKQREEQRWRITLYSNGIQQAEWIGWDVDYDNTYTTFATSNGYTRVSGTIVMQRCISEENNGKSKM